MTKEDLNCYRVNYKKKDWLRFQKQPGWVMMPVGVLDAIKCLCNEVERLQQSRPNK